MGPDMTKSNYIVNMGKMKAIGDQNLKLQKLQSLNGDEYKMYKWSLNGDEYKKCINGL